MFTSVSCMTCLFFASQCLIGVCLSFLINVIFLVFLEENRSALGFAPKPPRKKSGAKKTKKRRNKKSRTKHSKSTRVEKAIKNIYRKTATGYYICFRGREIYCNFRSKNERFSGSKARGLGRKRLFYHKEALEIKGVEREFA